jgi:hypothetical protein
MKKTCGDCYHYIPSTNTDGRCRRYPQETQYNGPPENPQAKAADVECGEFKPIYADEDTDIPVRSLKKAKK